jgi:cell division transport system permease protein
MVGSPFVHMIAVATLTLALTAYGSARLAGRALEALIDTLGDGLDVTIYLARGTTSGEALAARRAAAAIADSSEVRLVSPQAAMDRLAAQFGDQGAALGQLTENPLPWSLELRLPRTSSDPAAVRALAAKLRGVPGVEAVDYGEDAVAKLSTFEDALRRGALAVFGLVFATATVVVSATLQLAIFSRREEIEIQRLVGATGAFVRAPYLIEGVTQGLIAGPLALGLCALGVRALASHGAVEAAAASAALGWPRLLVELAVLGVSLGLLGSLLAVRRFLSA